MGDRWAMLRIGLLLSALSVGVLMLAAPAAAAPRHGLAAEDKASAVDVSAQRRRRVPQMRVQPRYPYRTFHSFYPLPYQVEYPGPNGVRECVNRYVLEQRPSGTVLVPRMRCWWTVAR
jgi:hypothetical protein